MNKTYTVYYKRNWIWRKIPNVVADGFVVDHFTGYSITYGLRYFQQEDGTVYELPVTCQFRFPPERRKIVDLQHIEKEKEDELARMRGKN